MIRLILLTLLIVTIQSMDAQRFVDPISLFSKNKTAYVTMKDGDKVEGELDKVKRKKGQVLWVRLELENGEEVELATEDIDFAFLPQSGFEKFSVGMDKATNVTRWGDESLEGKLIKDGYGYFESQLAQIKRSDEKYYLMQVLNPHFNKYITVYNDPQSGETMSTSVGGFQVAGGIDKSYYIQMEDDKPWRLKKKDYDENLDKLYQDCQKYIPEDTDRVVWKDLPKHIYNYSVNCN
ncbi:MAG: hypothetical protein R3275_06995 [Saprospiraceae bacterium]|nr:hypothetical protein [Saprospiraceae bacterium]